MSRAVLPGISSPGLLRSVPNPRATSQCTRSEGGAQAGPGLFLRPVLNGKRRD